jgi:GTP-binding protein
VNTSHAKFVLSAASASDFPATGIPEVALVGRSNVGKSSLINALTGQKIARTSAAPGKTRLANYYLIDFGLRASGARPRASTLYLVDLPGYGYARGGNASAEAFEQLAREYFDPTPGSGRRLAGVLQLIDARHPDLPQDAAAFAWLMQTGTPAVIVATKIDKLKRADQQKTVSRLERQHGVAVLPTSAMHGVGLDEIIKKLHHWSRSLKPEA